MLWFRNLRRPDIKPDSFKPTHFLEWFTKEPETSFSLNKPFSVTVDSRPFAVGTDSMILVAVQNCEGFLPYSGKKESVPNSVKLILSKEPSSWITIPSSSLLEACGGSFTIEKGPCGSCDDGQVDHTCDCSFCSEDTEECEDCDGTGSAVNYPEPRPRTIDETQFDTRKIAYVLMHCPSHPSVEFGLCPSNINDGTGMLILRTPSWTAVVMSMGVDHLDTPIPPPLFPKESQ